MPTPILILCPDLWVRACEDDPGRLRQGRESSRRDGLILAGTGATYPEFVAAAFTFQLGARSDSWFVHRYHRPVERASADRSSCDVHSSHSLIGFLAESRGVAQDMDCARSGMMSRSLFDPRPINSIPQPLWSTISRTACLRLGVPE